MNRFLAGFTGLLLCTLATLAAQPVVTVLPTAEPMRAGTVVRVNVAALNTEATALTFAPSATLAGRLVGKSGEWPVTLVAATTTAPASRQIEPGQFAQWTYTVQVPQGVGEGAIVQLATGPTAGEGGAVASANVEGGGTQTAPTEKVGATQTGATASKAARGGERSGLVPRPAAARLERTFREHFGTHEPVYFIYGDELPAAKFQVSFKYRLIGDAADDPEATRNSVQFGYTQRSLWDITGESSPFEDTSYMPEIFYEHLSPEDVEKSSLKWLGAQLGYKHESNGRGGAGSRSLNMVFARTAMAFGKLEGWRVVVAPRIYTYISDLSDNRDIKHYLGYGELRLIIGRNDGLELMLNGHLGSDWHRPTVEANFTYPLRWKFGDFASYLLVQYFHGYGESLLYYNQETESIRAGFSFVR